MSGANSGRGEQGIKQSFVQMWMSSLAVKNLYSGKTNEQYVEALYINTGVTVGEVQRVKLVGELNDHSATRVSVLLKAIDNDAYFFKKFDRTFICMMYFGYLNHNPGDLPDGDMSGFDFWLNILSRTHDYAQLQRAFLTSGEYNSR